MTWKFKKIKKWVACIVIFAFMFQAVPLYAFQDFGNQVPVTEEQSIPDGNVISSENNGTDFSLEDVLPEQAPQDVVSEEQNPTEVDTEANIALPESSDTNTPAEGEILTEEESEDSDYVLTYDDVYPNEAPVERVIEGELKDLREPNVKHFMNEDNTITASVYPCDVHYEDEAGVLQDIDNSLETTTDEESAKVLTNKENSFSVKFSKKIKEKNMVKLEKDGHQISWGLVGANGKKIIRQKESLIPKTTENPQVAQNATSTVVYSDIKENVDLQYDLLGTEIKESIILKDSSAPTTYQIRFNTKDLVIVEEDGNINFKTQDGTVVYQMMPLVMNDVLLETSMDIDVDITAEKENKNNHVYLITITPSKTWLNDPAREYPVIIDPSISTEPSPNIVMDTYVSSGAPNTVQGYTAGYLKAGMNGATENRTLINPQIPKQIKPSDRIVSAELYLTPYLYDNSSLFTQLQNTKGAPVIEAHEITEYWNDTTVTWNNQPSYDARILDYDYPSTKDGYNANNRFYTWDITQLVNRWCAAGSSNGLMLKYPDGYSNTMAVASFCSANYGTSAARPVFNITYLNMIGLEDYWTYHSQDAGLAGQGYINDYTGSLTTTFNDIDLDSEKLPLNISHVFSSYNCGEIQPSLNVGKGFRLSVQESIKTVTMMLNGQSVTKYLYTDGDGTQHYFEKGSDNVWRDDSGLDYTLEITSSSYTIRDKKDNLRIFDLAYDSNTKLLTQIKDNHSNTITMNFSGTKLRSVTDTDNRTVTFNVDSNNRLTSMSLPNGKTIAYEYTTSGEHENQIGCLAKVTFPGQSEVNTGTAGSANVAQFEYTVEGCVKKLTDVPKGMSIVYDVDWINSDESIGQWRNGFRRINSYSIVNNNNAVKNKYDIEYNAYNTKFIEKTPTIGRYEIYSFNTMGQTISALDQDGNAIFSAMGMSGGAKNKVTFASKTQRVMTNYLTNHDCERTSSFDITSSKTSENHIAFKTNGGEDTAFIGTGMLKMWKQNINSAPAYAAQTVSVPGNAKYTFSTYVKTNATPSSSTSGGAYIRVEGPSGVTAVEKADIISNNYSRHQVTIDLSNVPGTATLKVYIGMKNANNVVYFDGLQLEKGECANRYNLLENGDFEQTFATGWTGVNLGGNPAGIYDGIGSIRHSGTGGFQLYGLPKVAKQIKNTTSVMGKKGEGLVYGVWVKSNGLPDKDTAKDGTKQSIGVTLQLTSASGQKEFSSQSITPTNNEWIYITGNAIANFDYTDATLILKSNYNANYTHYDDAFLFKDSFGESFNYDAKGNIITAVDMAQNTESIVTNGNNDLTSYKDGMGNQYSFAYNADAKKHELQQCTAPDNTYTRMGYDTWGRITDVAIFPSAGSGEIRTKKIYSGSYLSQSIDQRGKTTYYNYLQNSGLLQNVSIPGNANIKTSYTYDGDTEKLTKVNLSGISNQVGYGYSKENLSKILLGSGNSALNYTLTYDAFGNLTSACPDKSGLSGEDNKEFYEYSPGRNLLSKVTFGNNQAMEYQYDNQDRIIGTTQNNARISSFDYNDNGLLGKSSYYAEGSPVSTAYQYDFADRYVSCDNTKGFGLDTITYDKNNNNTNYRAYLKRYGGTNKQLNVDYSTVYAYNNVNNPTKMIADNVSEVQSSYDSLGRNYLDHYTTGGMDANSGVWSVSEYLSSDSASTTNLLSQYRTRFSTSSISSSPADYTHYYAYDNQGNVSHRKTLTKGTNEANTYFFYDNLNQLTHANYEAKNLSDYYTYDDKGNILNRTTKYNSNNSVKNEATYTYEDHHMRCLDTYVQKAGTSTNIQYKYYYDDSGNPCTIVIGGDSIANRTCSLTWTQGKRLQNISDNKSMVNNTFHYNELGNISKVTKKDGSTIEYYYDDSQLEYEEYRNSAGTMTRLHKYFYDDDGNVRYLLVKTDQFTNKDAYNLYSYVYDGMGTITDLVKIRAQYSSYTVPYVATSAAVHYEYDAYGKILSTTNNQDNLANYNPICYKGYYYFNELSWYHLQSRFYDPETGRFINADDVSLLGETQGDLTDKNLYAYCDNNPVMRKDSDGEFWHILVGAGIGAVINASITVASNLAEGNKWSSGVGVSLMSGAATGGLAASGVGLVGQVVANGVANGVQAATTKGATARGVIGATAVGAIAGRIGGVGAGTTVKKMATQPIKRTKQAFKKTKNLNSTVKELKRALKFSRSQTRYLFKPKKAKFWQGMFKSNATSTIYNSHTKRRR